MNDPYIRERFKLQHLDRFNRENCLLFDELGIMQGSSIVDLAMITPTYFQAYEIKSGEDTLARLPNQIKKYNLVFDYISIILEEDHYFSAKRLIPPFWGVIIARKVRDVVSFEQVRHPTFNTNTTAESISQLLWKDEVYEILKTAKIKGISKLSKPKLWKVLVEHFTKEQIRQHVWIAMKKRSEWKKSF